MSGVTKHIYDHEIHDIVTMWNEQLKTIACVLPQEYEDGDIISLLKTYYPHEWTSVEMKYTYYTIKDKHILKRKGRARYNMKEPHKLLLKCYMYRCLISSIHKERHKQNFSPENLLSEQKKLWDKRKSKIEKINQKIARAKAKTQLVTPTFLDQLIGLYKRKNTSQKDRCYIIRELKKYYTDAIIQFFIKLNDTELNFQLRVEAHHHLQEFNYHPRLRAQKYMQVHTKNKKRKAVLKKDYAYETYHVPENPDELEYRLNNAKEQRIKTYDYFVSHSYMDKDVVQHVISHENTLGNNVYCDWISDDDYLKRNLLCEATLNVVKKRIEQSSAILFVESDHSLDSIWCKFELNYALSLGKDIFIINKDEIENKNFQIRLMTEYWFEDADYQRLALLGGEGVGVQGRTAEG